MIRKAAIVSISGLILTKQEIIIIKKEKPWGIILFKRNILSEIQLTNLIKNIKRIMKDKKYPILIDEEGGKVSRLSNFLDVSLYDQKFFGDIYKLNINTTPVLDLIKKNTHEVIGNRSYSENSLIVNELGKLCVQAYKRNKIATVIKHIPGHGGAKSDSHLKLPKVKDTLKMLKKTDFKCFKSISSFFAMTAHILYTKIDKKNNATHSSIILKKIIRKEIGFKGILISDDISMKALKYDIIKNAHLALNSGCNLILYCAGKTTEMKKLLNETPYIDEFTLKKTSEFYKFLS